MTEELEMHEGRWRPSVPVPLFCGLFVRCGCGKRFWGRTAMHGKAYARYERHYRARHIP